jgi:hypothetical protein
MYRSMTAGAIALVPARRVHRSRPNAYTGIVATVTGDVFLSYELAEGGYVDALARYLTAAGLPVWYEREVGGEERWAQTAEKIRTCAAFVVVMTPAAEQSPWVTGEINVARQLGKPILALALRGNVFAGLSHYPHEDVLTGAMPSAAFVTALRGLVAHPVPPPAPVPAGVWAPNPPPVNPTRYRSLLIAIGAIVLIGALVVAGLAGLLIVRGRTAHTTANLPWPQRAAAIPGIHDYLASNPEWFVIGADGNHRQGRLTYPTDPPVGGNHNPLWQNCMGDVYPAEIPKEQAVHSLEHGAVWVTYRPDLPKDQVDRLAAKVRDRPFLLMSPYPNQDQPISLQAWGYQLKVGNAGDARIDDFIAALRLNATQEPQAGCSNGITDTGTEPLSFS